VSRLLVRSSVRFLRRHPWQPGLSVLGIALGIAVVVAVDLVRESARRGFLLSTEAVAGRATHRIVGGPGGLDEAVFRRVRIDLGVRESAPVVEGAVQVRSAAAVERSGGPAEIGRASRALTVLGIDPFSEAPFRPYVGPAADGVELGVLLTDPSAALLSATTAAALGLAPGDSFAVTAGTVRRALVLAGTVAPEDALSRSAIADLLIMDIAAAQELLGRVGVLDRIDLRLAGGPAGAAQRAALEAMLPPGARLLDAGARADATAAMTRAFELNLTALGLVALLFGMFLIYNAITFSVVQRRGLIGLLRAGGVTRREVLRLMLLETAAVGAVASAVGLALGVLLGRGLVGLVTRTIQDLYFTVAVTGVALDGASLAKAVGLGMGATFVAALGPLHEAVSTTPRSAMLRSVVETGARRGVVRAAGLGVPALGAGILLLAAAGRDLVASLAAMFLILLAGALLAPLGTVALMRAIRPLAGRALGSIGRMAVGGVTAALSRTGPAVAALSVAVAVGIAMGLLIGSFRTAVADWLDHSLQADIYVAPPAATAGRVEATLDAGLVARIGAVPGVAGISTYRSVTIAIDGGDLRLIAVDLFPRHRAAFRLLAGRPREAWRDFEAGGLLVSEPFAYRHDVGPGDRFTVPTDRGPRAFPVAGVFRDYSSEHGIAFLDRRAYDAWFDDAGIGSLAVFAEAGTDSDALLDRLRAAGAGAGEILFRSNRALRTASLEVFDRTFAVTIVLRALALIVAFIGVLGSLMALQLERGRELAVLRATGLTPAQLRALVTSQAALLGAAAGALAVPLGLALAWTMVHVVNRRSFGWTMDLVVDATVLAQSVGLAVLAALLAGAGPAWRMARTPAAAGLREE
jgi:putative ABC transport system permease protein